MNCSRNNAELEEDFVRHYRINGRASIDDAEALLAFTHPAFFESLRVFAVTSELLERTLLELTVHRLLIVADH
jgi:hypothetical protein